MADISDPKGIFSSLRGVVETLEQKSGLNPLLFLDAILGIPAIGFYAWSGRSIILVFVWIPLIATVLIYGIAFAVDRNFLRSETHVREMRQLDILGQKGDEISESDAANLEPMQAPKQIPKGENKDG